ncbi:MAG TPA: bi-domain-containing oxidoreductase [Candidatus Saccharimonadales bacterium]|nr:bi-domain-containing oxidoreductase [Candidatus Saccharimonadales bacterium]
MKQIAQYQDGRLELQDVPQPVPPPGGILVRTTHSVISIGTERMKVQQAKMNLLEKARARPDQVRKVLDTARTLGWKSAYEKVRNRLETPTPLGYSAAGVVAAVDPANTRFRVGDRVACAGTECAYHAEFLAVPEMLAVPIPPGVENWQAAYTTIAAIGMQAVRQAEVQLGDKVLVIGQGLVGLMITALLRCAGARVMALDIQPGRRKVSLAMGAEKMVIVPEQDLAHEVRAWTECYGVDAAIICTSGTSNVPIEQAAEALRDRGRLVDVGITKIELPWKIFYEKELEVRFSRSYGPGRYDPQYEWGGVDYPIGYVRWTEQRNFQASLQLMASGQLDMGPLTTSRISFNDAISTYDRLLQDGAAEIGVVLEYGAEELKPAAVLPDRKASAKLEPVRVSCAVDTLDVIGAGNFARSMLLPHLVGKIKFGTVANQTALSAGHAKTKFNFNTSGTDSFHLLQNKSGHAVLIATRHHLHAPLLKAALSAGRHVFVEKPLCLTAEELNDLDAAHSSGQGSVMVGFNRRFAPASVEIHDQLQRSPGPKTAVYRVFAGKLDPTHWYANFAESGGRVLGEACHFLDYFCFLFGSKPVRVFAQTTWPAGGRLAFPDSVAAQVEFADGSCGQLIYSAEGDWAYPKERLTVYGAGIVAELENFQKLTIHRDRKKQSFSYTSKGHAEEMEAWLNFLSGKSQHPLPYEQSRESMLLTFAVISSIRSAAAVEVFSDNSYAGH